MRIVRIAISRVAMPFDAGGTSRAGASGQGWSRMESLIVRLESADGYVGYGEAFGHGANASTYAALLAPIGPWFLGREIGSIDIVMRHARRAFHGLGLN